jgi:hypothetical protein
MVFQTEQEQCHLQQQPKPGHGIVYGLIGLKGWVF